MNSVKKCQHSGLEEGFDWKNLLELKSYYIYYPTKLLRFSLQKQSNKCIDYHLS